MWPPTETNIKGETVDRDETSIRVSICLSVWLFLEYLTFHDEFCDCRIFWHQQHQQLHPNSLCAGLSDLHHGTQCSRSDKRNSKCARICMQKHCFLPSPVSPSSMSLNISNFIWLANAIYRINPCLPTTSYKSPDTGCVIRRVTLPVRAHLKPGCQCSISNIAMLCSSPVRCGRLTITRPKAYRYSSVTVVTERAVSRRTTCVEAPRSSNARKEGWHCWYHPPSIQDGTASSGWCGVE